MKPMVGYEWHEGRSKQVAYISLDHHLHELFVGLGGAWQHADLTTLASAPRAINRFLVGYQWSEGGSKQVAYLGEDGHIQELSVTIGGTWQHADLHAITGAPPAVAVTSGYASSIDRCKQVVFVGDDEHIHELSLEVGGAWRHIDLTAQTSAPLPSSKHMAAYEWKTGQCKQVAYVSQDGHIHELFREVGRGWQHADLSALTGVPRATAIMAGYEWQEGRAKQIVFVSEDGHIHELFLVTGNPWAHADLTALTHAPRATDVLTAYALPEGRTKQVAYVDQDSYIQELFVEAGGTWQHVNLTERSKAPLTPVTSLDGYGWSIGGSKQVAYMGDDGAIRELWMPVGGDWHYADLTEIVTAPPVRF